MKRIIFNMSQRNHIMVGDNKHIFINFTKMNLDFIIQHHPDYFQKIHIFITNHDAINDALKQLVDRYNKDIPNKTAKTRIVFHLSEMTYELEEFMENFLKTKLNIIIHKVDTKIIFGTFKHMYPHYLEISMMKHNLWINLQYHKDLSYLPTVQYNPYPYNISDRPDEEQGIFDNIDMRINPEQFKDQLVMAFKEKTPPGILKSFKNDNEIFEFIMQQGEWKEIKEVENNDNK